MEVVYKLKANEISKDLVDTIERLFGRNEITITVSGEADETSAPLWENQPKQGEFADRMRNVRPPEQRH